MQKERRQNRILDLIRDRRIGRQETIAELLLSEGFQVTQSSISRDLIELGIVKVDGRYAIPSRPNNTGAIGLVSLVPAGENLLVAKTESGMASAVCVRIDRAALGGIVGTVAGEDTIFIAVTDRAAQRDVTRAVLAMFGE
jgi:transcriptional regulator of arginine metabolism